MDKHKPATPPGFYKYSYVIDGLVAAQPSARFVRDLVNAGITACNWTVASRNDSVVTTLNKIARFYWLCEQTPAETMLVENSGDIQRAKELGKLGIILGFQGAGPLEQNVQLLRIYHRLGIRIIQLTYNEKNAFANGCTEPADGGLTSLGIQAVQEMNRLGLVIDLSHLGARSSLEAIEISEMPTIFSHSNPADLQPNPRNISDDQIKRCAEKGGVIGLATFSSFVGDTTEGRQPGLKDYFRQLDHVIDLVGPDHVAIGTDIFIDPTDGVWWRASTGRLYPEISQGMTYETHNIQGFMHQVDFPAVATAMLDHGYGESTAKKILGDNWLRVFGQVWGE